MDKWCILRTAGPRTLPLVRSLNEAGIAAWVPIAMRRQARPRSDKFRDIEAAMLPTFVFARAEYLPALLAAQHSPLPQHPAFTVLQHDGGYPMVSDTGLQPLREFEVKEAEEWQVFLAEAERARLERIRKRKRRKRPQGRSNPRRSYVMGQTVRVVDPAWEGLTGKLVEQRRNGRLSLIINDLLEIEVDACDVEPVQLSNGLPEQGKAA